MLVVHSDGKKVVDEYILSRFLSIKFKLLQT